MFLECNVGVLFEQPLVGDGVDAEEQVCEGADDRKGRGEEDPEEGGACVARSAQEVEDDDQG